MLFAAKVSNRKRIRTRSTSLQRIVRRGFLGSVFGGALGGAMLISADVAVAQIPGDSLVLEGDFIQTGVSNNGTLGVGGGINPGFIFDSTGTRNFNIANDYLTPGTPYEGFSVRYNGSGVIVNNNHGGTLGIGPSAAPTVVSSGVSGYDNAVTWSGSISGVLNMTHLYGLNNNGQRVEITTTITALTDLNDLKFARFIDPDSGGTNSINTRGNASLGLAANDWVNSESETNGATLGLLSTSSVTHNTAIVSFPWSNDPNVYLAGSGDSIGDDSIGLAFDIGTLLNGQSIELVYWYAVAASANSFNFGNGLADRAQTFNQNAVATYLDGLSSHPNADLQDLRDALIAMNDTELLAALDAISGSLYGTLPEANFQHTSYYLSHIASRLRNKMVPYGSPLYGDVASADPVSASRAAEMKQREIALVSYADGQNAANDASGGDCDAGCSSCDCLPCCGCSSWSGWITGYGLGGNAQSDGNADGFRYGLGGTQFGLERQVSDTTAMGAWGNVAWSNVRGDVLDENADIENYHFGAHLTWMYDDDYWIAIAGAGYDHYDIRRQTNVLAPVTAEGTMSGWQANTYLERGLTLCVNGWTVQPYTALQYIYLHQDDLVETGAGVLNLDVEDLDAHSLRSILGGRFARTFYENGRAITPEFRAAWMHEFLDTNQVVNTGLAGIGGAGFAVRGVDLGRDWATLGTGFNFHLTDATRLFAGYDLQFNDHQTFHVGSGGVEFVW
jgi:outer membrane autotransporter protein